jgi:hypothetical protein
MRPLVAAADGDPGNAARIDSSGDLDGGVSITGRQPHDAIYDLNRMTIRAVARADFGHDHHAPDPVEYRSRGCGRGAAKHDGQAESERKASAFHPAHCHGPLC